MGEEKSVIGRCQENAGKSEGKATERCEADRRSRFERLRGRQLRMHCTKLVLHVAPPPYLFI